MSEALAATSPRFAIFRAWVGAQQARAAVSGKRRDQFSEDTARIYASLWRGWLQWLAERGREWTEANAADIAAFLDGPAPAPEERRTRAPIQPKKMAKYTQQRYWRVLQAVYAHAVVNGLLSASPCTGVADKPRMTARAQTRQLLPPGVIGLLRDPMELERFVPLEHQGQWWVLRDRAAVALAAHCGLSAAELIALRGADLRVGRQMLTTRSPQLRGLESQPAWVDLPARNGRPARSLRLPEVCMSVLEAWLARRAEVLQAQARDFAAQGHKAAAPTPANAPLLLSREAPTGRPLPAVDAPTLYYGFRKCLVAAMTEAGHDLEAGYVARGPSILRNSVIAHWAATVGPESAAQLAGLKPASLRAAAGAGASKPSRKSRQPTHELSPSD
ncbi:MAG TPA: hypothetical protein VHL79_24465 [Ramlibacter sp.]|jgi:integrase|nr:hypothetical protein [Ramlibacter sp.]